jgi:general secretion pathway protein G
MLQINTLSKKEKNTHKIQGFTLIELVVVIAILAILATFVLPNFLSRPDQARVAKAQQDIKAMESALQLYKLDNFNYPTTSQGLRALSKKPEGARFWNKGGYMDRIPKDPWGNDYNYASPGSHGKIDIYSYGADGVSGGTEFDADIVNWEVEKTTN